MSKKGHISEEKARRIAVGATVGGVLLIIFLLIVLIVQFVQIGVRRSELNELEEMKARQTEQLERDEDKLEIYRTESGLYYLARKSGWR